MAGDFPAHLGDKLFGAPEKVHTSAAKFVFQTYLKKQIALLNAKATVRDWP